MSNACSTAKPDAACQLRLVGSDASPRKPELRARGHKPQPQSVQAHTPASSPPLLPIPQVGRQGRLEYAPPTASERSHCNAATASKAARATHFTPGSSCVQVSALLNPATVLVLSMPANCACNCTYGGTRMDTDSQYLTTMTLL
jgi:hypothetical protein